MGWSFYVRMGFPSCRYVIKTSSYYDLRLIGFTRRDKHAYVRWANAPQEWIVKPFCQKAYKLLIILYMLAHLCPTLVLTISQGKGYEFSDPLVQNVRCTRLNGLIFNPSSATNSTMHIHINVKALPISQFLLDLLFLRPFKHFIVAQRQNMLKLSKLIESVSLLLNRYMKSWRSYIH